jgi:DNA-binding transcriptional ArsR family regulator
VVTDQLSTTFAALADPTRRAILARLTAGAHSVSDLAEPHDMSLPAISKHLKVLERSGLIVRGREAQWRPCQLQAGPLKEAVNWLEFYRRHWEESFDRLDDYLQRLQGKPKKPHARPTSPVRRPKAQRSKTKVSVRPSRKNLRRS